MDFINRIVQVLKEDLYWIRISTQDAELIEPVKLWDKEQPSHIADYELCIKRTHVLMYSYTKRTNVLTY